jgi:hypothetical protein
MKRVGLWMIGIGLFLTVMLFPPVFGIIGPTAGANAYACAGGACDDSGGDDED